MVSKRLGWSLHATDSLEEGRKEIAKYPLPLRRTGVAKKKKKIVEGRKRETMDKKRERERERKVAVLKEREEERRPQDLKKRKGGEKNQPRFDNF